MSSVAKSIRWILVAAALCLAMPSTAGCFVRMDDGRRGRKSQPVKKRGKAGKHRHNHCHRRGRKGKKQCHSHPHRHPHH